MRTLAITQNITLDGAVEMLGDGFDPPDDATGVTDHLKKYVVSTTLTDPEWENSTILSGDPVAEVTALKRQPCKDIVVTGSIRLCHTLIEAGLVDEFRLFHHPVVQGRYTCHARRR